MSSQESAALPATTGLAPAPARLPGSLPAWLCWGMRLLLGGVFLTSGFLKLKDPGLFSMDVRNFDLIGDPWIAVVALTLPWLELITGGGVAARIRPIYRGSLLLLAGSLAMFILALAISWARGLEISCGCFGASGEVTNYPLAILRNLVLLAVAAVLWWREDRT